MVIGLIATIAVATAILKDSRPVCTVTRATVFYDRLADLPPEIQKEILAQGDVADPDRPFNRTDAIEDSTVPFRRLVRAGSSGGSWFVWLEHGGLAYHYDIFGFLPLHKAKGPPQLVMTAAFTGEPCVAINAILNGVYSSRETNMPSADSM